MTNGRKSSNLVKSHELICHIIRLYLVPLPPQFDVNIAILYQKNTSLILQDFFQNVKSSISYGPYPLMINIEQNCQSPNVKVRLHKGYDPNCATIQTATLNLELVKRAKQRHTTTSRDRRREKIEHQAYHHMGCVALLPYIMMCLALWHLVQLV